MNTKLYVDNLAIATTEKELMELFSVYGNVVTINIAVDRTSHKPRGFGFVTMVTAEGAQAAIQALNGRAMETGALIVREGWLNEESARQTAGRPVPRRRASQLY